MSSLSEVRIVRPYATESEWLHEEGWTVAKKSVYLIGIAPMPEGTAVRCELELASGQRLLVAEGVVVKYSTDSGDRPPGLVVRYRRLSSASSQFINRVLSARDASELSSPSSADNPVPSSATNNSIVEVEPSSAVQPSRLSPALERLRGRSPAVALSQQERDEALHRLRDRRP